MKIFVTGIRGQLGSDVAEELNKRGIEPIGFCSDQLDITDWDAINQFMLSNGPDAVIHCASWTAVDLAEDVAVFDRVNAVNSTGTRYIAEVCRGLDIPMMYISTDYVFDGTGSEPWEADCKLFNPLSVYGRTKLEGEKAVSELLSKFFIVRISWAFGIHGSNFVKTMIKLGKTHDTLRVVNDQIGTPTYTRDLARLLADMIVTDKYGFYHATNEGGYISWCDFARTIFEETGMNVKVLPVTTAEYGISKAARPLNSRLDCSKLREYGFEPLPEWHDALKRFIVQLKECC